ncbi:MAG: CvpA family protein [Proteobacteria bacterium]|nr:CvpA family protein [Pseudomonadota bacterium]
MPVVDIAIAVVVMISVGVGFVRGLVKEALSVASLLAAVWTAFHFGAEAGTLSDSWLSSPELQLWFGRILLFIVVLMLGGLLSWAIAKLVRLSVLSGTDRVLGMIFGLGRGALLVAVVVIGGQYADFDDHRWWEDSVLMPYAEFVADWLRVMAPKGLELIRPGLETTPPINLPLPDIAVLDY